MIKTKADLKEYMLWDQIALGKENRKRPQPGRDEIWRFERLLRKHEYYTNNADKSPLHKLMYLFSKFKFHRQHTRLGFEIPVNTVDKGLCIAHIGSVIVNGNARIGKNCRIHEGVTIGATGGSAEAPQIGSNVFIATGAKIIGAVTIADDVVIGANAVVVKSVTQPGVTVGGVPAKVISNNGSDAFINKRLKDME